MRVRYSGLAMVALVIWTFGASYFPVLYPEWSTALVWGMAFLATALFVAALFFHELAHTFAARRQGIVVAEMTLNLFGGLSRLEREPDTPAGEFWIAFAGPGASLLVGGAYFLGSELVPWVSLAAALRVSGSLSLALGVFNLLPGFPLDGGRVFHAAMWALKGDRELAMRWASRLGQVIALGMTFLGIVLVVSGQWIDGMWLMGLSIILNRSSRTALTRSTVETLLEGHTVSEVMEEGGVMVPPQLTLDVLVEQYMGHGRTELAVGRADNVVGLVNARLVSQVVRANWKTSRVRDVMLSPEDHSVIGPGTALLRALERMAALDLARMPVILNSTLAGTLSRDRLLRFLDQLQVSRGNMAMEED